MRPEIRLATAALLLLAMAGCREAQAPFASDDRLPISDSAGLRLTFSLGRDRSPVWNAAGDSVYYVATGNYPGLPSSQGVLVAIPSAGGVVQPILRARQVNVTRPGWFTAGVISPSGTNIAFVELTDVATPQPCASVCVIEELPFIEPVLVSGVLRVSRLDAAATSDEAALPIAFPGRTFDTTNRQFGLQGTWLFSAYPFQVRFVRAGAHSFRPSWAPDGSRLVFSDGLRLYIWNIGSAQASEIPGTTDGIYPAWSPDGEWIAFTRQPRGDSIINDCVCLNERGQVADHQLRTSFDDDSLGPGELLLIRPDGTGPHSIGEGDAATWTPAGGLVFRRAGQLWRSAADGSQATPIANTQGGWEPSVSASGQQVAFVRELNGNYDVWVVPLATN